MIMVSIYSDPAHCASYYHTPGYTELTTPDSSAHVLLIADNSTCFEYYPVYHDHQRGVADVDQQRVMTDRFVSRITLGHTVLLADDQCDSRV